MASVDEGAKVMEDAVEAVSFLRFGDDGRPILDDDSAAVLLPLVRSEVRVQFNRFAAFFAFAGIEQDDVVGRWFADKFRYLKADLALMPQLGLSVRHLVYKMARDEKRRRCVSVAVDDVDSVVEFDGVGEFSSVGCHTLSNNSTVSAIDSDVLKRAFEILAQIPVPERGRVKAHISPSEIVSTPLGDRPRNCVTVVELLMMGYHKDEIAKVFGCSGKARMTQLTRGPMAAAFIEAGLVL